MSREKGTHAEWVCRRLPSGRLVLQYRTGGGEIPDCFKTATFTSLRDAELALYQHLQAKAALRGVTLPPAGQSGSTDHNNSAAS